MTDRKVQYHIEDFASAVINDDWSLAFNAAFSQIKQDFYNSDVRPIAELKLGARRYTLKSVINNIDFPVQIIGVGYEETSGYDPAMAGSVLYITQDTYATRFNVTGINARGFFLDRVAVVEQHNFPADGTTSWTPAPFDFFIKIQNILGGVRLGDVYLASVNKGCYIRDAGRVEFDRFRGQLYTIGIDIDNSLDANYARTIHFWPFSSADWRILQYQQSNMIALKSGRSDGFMIDNFFTFASFFGVNLVNNGYGVTTNLRISNLYCDFSFSGLFINDNVNNSHLMIDKMTVQNEKIVQGGSPGNGTSMTSAGGIHILGAGNHCQIPIFHSFRSPQLGIWINGPWNRIDIMSGRFELFDTFKTGCNYIGVDPNSVVQFAVDPWLWRA